MGVFVIRALRATFHKRTTLSRNTRRLSSFLAGVIRRTI